MEKLVIREVERKNNVYYLRQNKDDKRRDKSIFC